MEALFVNYFASLVLALVLVLFFSSDCFIIFPFRCMSSLSFAFKFLNQFYPFSFLSKYCCLTSKLCFLLASLSCSRNNCIKYPIFAKSYNQFLPDLFLIGTASNQKETVEGKKKTSLSY